MLTKALYVIQLFHLLKNLIFTRRMKFARYFILLIFLIIQVLCRKSKNKKLHLLIVLVFGSLLLFLTGLPFFLYRRCLIFVKVTYSDFIWKVEAVLFYLNFYFCMVLFLLGCVGVFFFLFFNCNQSYIDLSLL